MKTSWRKADEILRFWIFGGFLPYIGWITCPCYPDGELAFVEESTLEYPETIYERDVLVVEWLWFGVTLLASEVRKSRTK